MKFLYLIPRSNKYYQIRNEEFIAKELKKETQQVVIIKYFYNINVIYQILFNKPDAVFFNSLNIGRKIKWLMKYFINLFDVPIYWWYFDGANASNRRLYQVEEIAKRTSIFFNKDKSNFLKYNNIGINTVWLDQGVPNILKFNKSNKKYEFDIGFFGSLSSVHKDRTNILKEIDNRFNLVIYSKDKKKFKKLGFKNVKNFVFKDQISQVVSKIKIILVLNAACVGQFYWSDRIHIMIGSGAFCLTEQTEGIEKMYKSGKHHIIFKNEKELLNLIEFWLKHNAQREQIRYDGYYHAHQIHSYNMRVKEFLSLI